MKYLVEVNGREFELGEVPDGQSLAGEEIRCSLERGDASGTATLHIGNRVYRVQFDVSTSAPQKGMATIWVNGERVPLRVLNERARRLEALAAVAAPARRGAELHAPMPGMIVKVHVVVGQQVAEGDGLVVMEAMKMENELRARASGVVTQVHVVQGRAVEKGMLLVEIG